MGAEFALPRLPHPGGGAVIFAYADPPYLGCCRLYGHHHPEGGRPFDGRCWDEPETHRLLIEWLAKEFGDGWALSAGAPSLGCCCR